MNPEEGEPDNPEVDDILNQVLSKILVGSDSSSKPKNITKEEDKEEEEAIIEQIKEKQMKRMKTNSVVVSDSANDNKIVNENNLENLKQYIPHAIIGVGFVGVSAYFIWRKFKKK